MAAKKKQPIPSISSSAIPAQGDHVFGNVTAAVSSVLQEKYGSTQGWENRMPATLKLFWDEFKNFDLGHSNLLPAVTTSRPISGKEDDNHAEIFGAATTTFCSIFKSKMSTQGRGWRTEVLRAFDDLCSKAVDETALSRYLGNSPRTKDHKAISVTSVAGMPKISKPTTPEAKRINKICGQYLLAKPVLDSILFRL